MRIAVLGGGFTGMTAAYYLAKKGHKVTLFEKEKVLGGLAVGFKQPDWDWYLERAYHHLLDSEDEILDFAKEIDFEEVFFKETITSSLYDLHPQGVRSTNTHPEGVRDYRIFPLDSPQDFLRFPLLSWPENILASFIWARITKRAKKLGYIKGGFQTLINYVENRVKGLGVRVKKDFTVDHLGKSREGFVINNKEKFDVVISTLPTVIMSKITQTIFPTDYLQRFSKLKYLHAVVLILETKQPILEKTYWLNICTDKLPLMIVGQHTNFIDKRHYGGNHIAYIGWYVERDDPLI